MAIKTLVAILLLGLLVRVPNIALGWYASRDITLYIKWGQSIESQGLEHVYEGPGISPPVLIYLLGGTIWLGEHLGLYAASSPGESRWATFIIQLTANLADILTAALLAWVMWRRSFALGLVAAGVYLFNPAVWYDSAVWGQTDSLYTLLLLACVIALERRKVLLPWALYALALGTKLQAIALAPLVLVWTLAKHGLRGLLAGLAISSVIWAVLFAPWLLSGHSNDVVQVYTTPVEMRTVVSAYNFWYLVLGGNLAVSSEIQPTVLPLSYRDLGTALFMIMALLIVWLTLRRRDGESLAIPSAMLTLSMFLLLTQMHERHDFPTLAFLAWGAAEWAWARRSDAANGRAVRSSFTLWCIYGLVTLTSLHNMVTIVPFSPAFMTSIVVENVNSARWLFLKGTSLVVAGVNIAVLVWLIWITWQQRKLDPFDGKKAVQPLTTT